MSASNGVAPVGCQWNTTYNYLNCDSTDLVLDHVRLSGGIYWSGCGNLTIRQSVIEGYPSKTWHNVYAACSAGKAGAELRIEDSTMSWHPTVSYAGGTNVANLWTGSSRPMKVTRSVLRDLPQGLGPTPGSIIEQSEIIAPVGVQCPGEVCHTDGLFSQGGDNVIYRYNNITVPTSGQATAAVFWQNRSGTNTGGVMEGNYLVGGAYTLRNETMRGLVVRNNTFGGGLYGDCYTETSKGGSIAVWEGNKHVDGSAVTCATG